MADRSHSYSHYACLEGSCGFETVGWDVVGLVVAFAQLDVAVRRFVELE